MASLHADPGGGQSSQRPHGVAAAGADPRQQQKLAPAPGSDHRGPNGYTAEMGFRARVWHVDLRDVEPRQGRRPQSGPLLQS